MKKYAIIINRNVDLYKTLQKELFKVGFEWDSTFGNIRDGLDDDPDDVLFINSTGDNILVNGYYDDIDEDEIQLAGQYVLDHILDLDGAVQPPKKIEFLWQLVDNDNPPKLIRQRNAFYPENFTYIKLICPAVDNIEYDTMLAYDDESQLQDNGSVKDGIIFLGHWNDGVK